MDDASCVFVDIYAAWVGGEGGGVIVEIGDCDGKGECGGVSTVGGYYVDSVVIVSALAEWVLKVGGLLEAKIAAGSDAEEAGIGAAEAVA